MDSVRAVCLILCPHQPLPETLIPAASAICLLLLLIIPCITFHIVVFSAISAVCLYLIPSLLPSHPSSHPGHHGPDLPPRQLCVRPVGRGEQLGEGALHRGRRARGQRARRGQEGGRGLRLPAGQQEGGHRGTGMFQGFQLAHSLGGGTGSGMGTLLISKVTGEGAPVTSAIPDQGGVPRQDYEHIQRHPLA